jgi:hypothetical protein
MKLQFTTKIAGKTSSLGFLRYFCFVKRFIPSYVFDGQNYAKTGYSQPQKMKRGDETQFTTKIAGKKLVVWVF